MVKKGRNHKVHSLTGGITDELMIKAFKAVKRNRGAAGIDKVSIQMYENNLKENLESLKKQLKSRSFEPIPLRRAYIPKSKHELRPLGIPSVRCRAAHEVVRQLINPIFEPLFHDDSYGFIRGRNCHQAIERIIQLTQEGYTIIVEADIKGFFDNIPHYLIMEQIANEIADGNILRLIEKFLRSGVMENGVLKPTLKGTPQGGVISPLLANIVLNKLDWELEANGFKFVRYADDFVVMCKTVRQAEEALKLVRHVVEEKLELKLHPNKTQIVSYNEGFEFLGFFISPRSTRMRKKSEEKFKMKIRDITTRSHNLDAEVIVKLNRVIRGTMNYFATPFSTGMDLFRKLDRWIRLRIRCMKYKRIWKTDNFRLRKKHIRHLELLSCLELFYAVKEH